MNRNPFYISAIISLLLLALIQTGCQKDEGSDNIPVVSTHEITNIKILSATSGGTISSDQGAEVIFRGVCWSTKPNPTISDNKTVDGTGAGTFSSRIEGLEANTTYYARAYATNINGTGYGSTMKLTTIASQFTDDRDGNVYQIVEIGNQIWMAENLKYLPAVVGTNYVSINAPYYYVYGNNSSNVALAKSVLQFSLYGVLYNWSAAINACPVGWHLPSDEEWTVLSDYLGGPNSAGGKLKANGTNYWISPNTGATNETGFTALPGGFLSHNGYDFNYIGIRGYWWSSTDDNTPFAWARRITNNSADQSRTHLPKAYGFSVRCARD
jgi:uncharacterized protein (TIGR02145 family)